MALGENSQSEGGKKGPFEERVIDFEDDLRGIDQGKELKIEL